MQNQKKNKRQFPYRYTVLIGLIVLIMFVFVARLASLQLVGNDFYVSSADNTYKRIVTIQAQRGEIYDRNGNKLVSSEYTYDIVLDWNALNISNTSTNDELLSIDSAFGRLGISRDGYLAPSPFTGTADAIGYAGDFLEGESLRGKLVSMLKHFSLKEDTKAGDFFKTLCRRWGLTGEKGVYLYSEEELFIIIRYRWSVELKRLSSSEPYMLYPNADKTLVINVMELNLRGISIKKNCVRVYEYEGIASHILGQTGKIQSGKVEYYSELGYPMDATVGISGAEYVFEQYLHGTDGQMVVVEDAYGNILEQYMKTEPKAGYDVYLTIDINMQIAAEKALKENIELIVAKALAKEGELDGEDARAGALAVVNPYNGEVLTLASNPTYNLATYQSDYAALAADPGSPLVNRALGGTYSPGSTFKLATAAAALTEGVVTPEENIKDLGIYRYYETNGPKCWIYSSYGTTHGDQNVTLAIQNSCNYYFYEAGRRLTIRKLNYYCRLFGLGEKTGIEFPESTGTLAGPDYAESAGLGIWYDGDTLSAAIGQSYNSFTPLQISVYLSTLINGGTRYSAHLLYCVKSFSGELIYKPEPAVLNTVPVSAENIEILKNAMKSAAENGSASRLFSNYPIEMGGKTGTAQVSSKKSDNALFMAFAPYDIPELAVTCVIEQGANGTDAGEAVKDIFDYYFKVGGYKQTE